MLLLAFWSLAFLSLIFGPAGGAIFWGPLILEGPDARWYSLGSAAVVGVMIAGLLLRQTWTRIIACVYYGFSTLGGVLAIFALVLDPESYLNFFRYRLPDAAAFVTFPTVLVTVIVVNLLGLIIAVAVLVYLLRTPYFNREEPSPS